MKTSDLIDWDQQDYSHLRRIAQFETVEGDVIWSLFTTVRGGNSLHLLPESAEARELADAEPEDLRDNFYAIRYFEGNQASSPENRLYIGMHARLRRLFRGTWIGVELGESSPVKALKMWRMNGRESPFNVEIELPPVAINPLGGTLNYQMKKEVCGFWIANALGNAGDDPTFGFREEFGRICKWDARPSGTSYRFQPLEPANFGNGQYQLNSVERDGDEWIAFERDFHIFGNEGENLRELLRLPPQALRIRVAQVLDTIAVGDREEEWLINCRLDGADLPVFTIWNDLIADQTVAAMRSVRNSNSLTLAPRLYRPRDGRRRRLAGIGDLRYSFKLSGSSLANSTRLDLVLVDLSSSKNAESWSLDELQIRGLHSHVGTHLREQNHRVGIRETEGEIVEAPPTSANGTFLEFFLLGNGSGDKRKFSIGEADSETDSHNRFREGAFDLTLKGELSAPDGSSEKGHFGRLTSFLQIEQTGQPFYLWQWTEEIDAQNPYYLGYLIEDLQLPVEEVRAGAQDALPEEEFLAHRTGAEGRGTGFQRRAPLVLQLPDEAFQDPILEEQANKSEVSWALKISSESAQVGQSQRISMELEKVGRQSVGVDVGQVLVIDPEPFSISLVDVGTLRAEPTEGSSIVARKSPLSVDGHAWEVLAPPISTGVKLLLPAQGIGEAMEKFEGSTMGDPSEGALVDYRLTAPTIIRFNPTAFNRRYAEVGWNLRRLMGVIGQRQPGVPLLNADFELLYGLKGVIEEDGLWLNEIASTLGELPFSGRDFLPWPATKEQQKTFDVYWNRYQDNYRAWLSRVGLLVPRDGSIDTPLELASGIEYRMRVEAGQLEDLAPAAKVDSDGKLVFKFTRVPLHETASSLGKKLDALQSLAVGDLVGANAASLQVSKNTEGTTDGFVIDPATVSLRDLKEFLRENLVLNPRGARLRFPLKDEDPPIEEAENLKRRYHDPEGLSGGAHWGFESLAIYDEFWRNHKKSSSGEIKKLAFSSLGGWGHQTARFAHDKTIIQSDTTMGRTHFYAVERIGRIGVFWNKAKHVIIYERSTAPTRQFRDDQDQLLGRPIVRKVKEYVEILEPERSYPDFGEVPPNRTGFVLACKFPKESLVIPVTSKWGRDIRGRGYQDNGATVTVVDDKLIGWEVPLWRPDAVPEVYPKPQITLEVATDPDSGRESAMVNLDQPQSIFFYTDTREFDISEIDIGSTVPKRGLEILSDDVHAWPSVPEVDFSVFPEPLLPEVPSADPANPDADLPPALSIPPGFERFTFPIASTTIEVNLTAHQITGSSMNAVVRNVSMMRSNPTSVGNNWWQAPTGDATKDATKGALSALLGHTPGEPAGLDSAVNGLVTVGRDRPTKIEDVVSEYERKLGGARAKLNVLANSLAPDGSRVCAAFSSMWPHPAGAATLGTVPAKLLWEEILIKTCGFHERSDEQLDKLFNDLVADLDRIERQSQDPFQSALALLGGVRQQLKSLRLRFDVSFSKLVSQPQKAFSRLQNQIVGAIAKAFANVDSILAKGQAAPDKIDALAAELTTEVDRIGQGLKDTIEFLESQLLKLSSLQEWNDAVTTRMDALTALVDGVVDDVVDPTVGTIERFKDQATQEWRTAFSDLRRRFKEIEQNLKSEISRALGSLESDLTSVLRATEEEVEAVADGIEGKIITPIENKIAEWELVLREGSQTIGEVFSTVKGEATTLKAQVKAEKLNALSIILYNDQGGVNSVYEALQGLDSLIGNAFPFSLIEAFKNIDSAAEDLLKTLAAYKRLEEAFSSGNEREIIRELENLSSEVNEQLGELVGEVAEHAHRLLDLKDHGDAAFQSGTRALRSIRSLCEELKAPGLGFNRKTVALLIKHDGNVGEALGITPCMARLKEFGDDLEALGLRVPTKEIAERLLPSSLSDFDFGKILSDIGPRLDGLLPGFKMPDSVKDNIELTQGLDKQNQRAWAKAKVDFKINEKKTLFSLGPVELSLASGEFKATVSMEIDLDGRVEKSAEGQLTGDWEVAVGGQIMFVFEEATAHFKEGKLDFDINPARIRMAGMLQLLSDVTKNIPGQEEGFRIGLVQVGEIPVGAIAELNLPPFDIGAGTTSMTGVQLGGFFEIRALDDDLDFDFSLGTGFHLSSEAMPFNLAIFFLGGGGYCDVKLRYWPSSKELASTVTIGVNVSAVAALSFGFASGTVGVYLGIFAIYDKPREASSGTVTAGVSLLVQGRLDILGLVEVYLGLLLKAAYRQGTLIGTGRVTLKIKICWCITIKVDKSITYKFGGGRGNQDFRALALESPFADRDCYAEWEDYQEDVMACLKSYS